MQDLTKATSFCCVFARRFIPAIPLLYTYFELANESAFFALSPSFLSMFVSLFFIFKSLLTLQHWLPTIYMSAVPGPLDWSLSLLPLAQYGFLI